jgi:hypothetical protein
MHYIDKKDDDDSHVNRSQSNDTSTQTNTTIDLTAGAGESVGENVNIIIRCISCGIYKYERRHTRRNNHLCRACAGRYVDKTETLNTIMMRLQMLNTQMVSLDQRFEKLSSRVTALELAESRRERMAELVSVGTAERAGVSNNNQRSSAVDTQRYANSVALHEQNNIIASLSARIYALESQCTLPTPPVSLYELPPSMGWHPHQMDTSTIQWLIPPDDNS